MKKLLTLLLIAGCYTASAQQQQQECFRVITNDNGVFVYLENDNGAYAYKDGEGYRVTDQESIDTYRIRFACQIEHTMTNDVRFDTGVQQINILNAPSVARVGNWFRLEWGNNSINVRVLRVFSETLQIHGWQTWPNRHLHLRAGTQVTLTRIEDQ